MDKCKIEKEKLYELACIHEKNYYVSEVEHKDSYFIKKDGGACIREYGFETLPDLKKELEEMWKQDEIMQSCIKTVLIAAFKLKPTEQMSKKKEKAGSSTMQAEDKLSPFIYNF